jgi:hypothetical protein
MLQDALESYLGSECGVCTVITTSTLEALIESLDACAGDSPIILDADAIPGGNIRIKDIKTAIAGLRARHPRSHIIFLANSSWDEAAATQAGADHALRKGALGAALAQIIKRMDL